MSKGNFGGGKRGGGQVLFIDFDTRKKGKGEPGFLEFFVFFLSLAFRCLFISCLFPPLVLLYIFVFIKNPSSKTVGLFLHSNPQPPRPTVPKNLFFYNPPPPPPPPRKGTNCLAWSCEKKVYALSGCELTRLIELLKRVML